MTMTDDDILPPTDAQVATEAKLNDTGAICDCLFDVFGAIDSDVFASPPVGEAINYLSDIDRRLEKALIEINSGDADPVEIAEYVSKAHHDALRLRKHVVEQFDTETLDESGNVITTPRCDTLRELLDALRDDVLQARVGVTMWKQLTR